MTNNAPKRVTLKQYTEEMGMEHLYWEDNGPSDGYFLEYDQLEEYCRDEEISLPKEVYGCKNEYPKLYGENLIDELEEQLELEESSQLYSSAQKEIMEWVEMFNKRLQEVHGQHIFYPDKSVVVVLKGEPST